MSTVDQLAEEIASLAAHLDAATARLLVCIRGFDEQGGWASQGAVSCAHWLSWRIGVDLPTAREKVRVARALASLPGIEEALTRGELSYAKARALTRVATPENEQRLLELARHATGAQLERICRGYRQVAASLIEEGPLVEERSVRERLLPGGMVRLELVLHPDEAALVRLAIEKSRDELRTRRKCEARAEGLETAPQSEAGAYERRQPSARGADLAIDRTRRDNRHVSAEAPVVSLADAAVAMAEAVLADEAGAGRVSGGDRYQVFVHLDQDVLGADGDWAATLDDGTRLPAETLRRIACDCALVGTRTDAAGSVLDVGRRTRSISPAIRRALWLRDRGCRFPGCGHTRFLHGHHVRHWLAGGPTRLDNLVLLCSRHHRLLHEEGFLLEPTSEHGALTFRTRNGNLLPALPTFAMIEDAHSRLQAWAAERGLDLGPDTNLPWWDGASPDYDWILMSLFSDRQPRQPAAPPAAPPPR